MSDTVSMIDKHIAEYEGQLRELQQGLNQLEQEYQKKKEQGTTALHQLVGAIQALHLLQDAETSVVVNVKEDSVSKSFTTVEELLAKDDKG